MKKTHYVAFSVWFILFTTAFISCNKDGLLDNDLETKSLEEFRRINSDIANVLNNGSITSIEGYISQLKMIQGIQSVVDDGVYLNITTKADGLITVDIRGYSSIRPISDTDRIDTCGVYFSSLIDKKDQELLLVTTEGVFSDPIEIEECEPVGEDGDELEDTRAGLSVGHRTLLSKKKMAYWCPWDGFREIEVPDFKNCLSKYGIKNPVIDDCSPSSFSRFGNYDLVFISSHATVFGEICLPQSYWDEYLEPYITSVENGVKLVDQVRANGDGIHTHFVRTMEGEFLESVCLGYAFFMKYLPDLSKTVLWTSACYLGTSGSAFLYSAKKKNCPEYYGADNACDSSGPMSVFIKYIQLLAAGTSAKIAFESSLKYIVQYHSYNYLRYGNKNVTYVVPNITGARECGIRTATLGVRFQFSLDIAGAADSSTPNHLGIRIENLKSNTHRDIPLSSSILFNRQWKTDFDWYNVFLADAAIEGLEPETKYRYRTYVQVGNNKLFSDNVQQFETRGLSGLWTVKGDHIPENKAYWEFISTPFPGYGGSMTTPYSTVINGESISFKIWLTSNPYGECGGERSTIFVGSIDSNWSSIVGTMWGYRLYGTRQEECGVGPHRHNGDPQYFEMLVVPNKYNYVR